MHIAVFGDLFVRAAILEETLRRHLAPIVGQLSFRSCELGYPVEPARQDAEIREFVGRPEDVLEIAADAEIILSHMPPDRKSVV